MKPSVQTVSLLGVPVGAKSSHRSFGTWNEVLELLEFIVTFLGDIKSSSATFTIWAREERGISVNIALLSDTKYPRYTFILES